MESGREGVERRGEMSGKEGIPRNFGLGGDEEERRVGVVVGSR